MWQRLIDAVKGMLLQKQSSRRESALRIASNELNLVCSEECPNCEEPAKTYIVLTAVCSSCDHTRDITE